MKNPNTQNKDLRSINVASLDGRNCAFELDGICFGAPFKPDAHIWNACDTNGKTTDPDDLAFMSKNGIEYCMTSRDGKSDYWAGAVERCGGVDKMPTIAQLTALANELYDKPISGSGTATEYANWNKEKAESMGFDTSLGYFYVWSGKEDSENYAYNRSFASNGTSYYGSGRGGSIGQTFCLAD